jgi:hypothetical protein
MVNNPSFPGCSKRARCKAPEILRSEAYLKVHRNRPAPCLTRGRMREIPRSAGLTAIFQQPVLAATFARIKILFQTATSLSHGFLDLAIEIRRELFHVMNVPAMFLEFLKKLQLRGRTGCKRAVKSKIFTINLFIHIFNPLPDI